MLKRFSNIALNLNIVKEMLKYRVKEVLKYCVKYRVKKLKCGVKIENIDKQLDFKSNCVYNVFINWFLVSFSQFHICCVLQFVKLLIAMLRKV